MVDSSELLSQRSIQSNSALSSGHFSFSTGLHWQLMQPIVPIESRQCSVARKICLERIVTLKISLRGHLLEADQSRRRGGAGRTNKQSVCNCVTQDTARVRAVGQSSLYRHCHHLVSNGGDSGCYALSGVLVLQLQARGSDKVMQQKLPQAEKILTHEETKQPRHQYSGDTRSTMAPPRGCPYIPRCNLRLCRPQRFSNGAAIVGCAFNKSEQGITRGHQT